MSSQKIQSDKSTEREYSINVIEMNKDDRAVPIPEAIEQGNYAPVRYNAMRARGKIWPTG